MENQELFDKYIKGLLSESEKTEFESRLMNDNALTSEFKTYLFVVKGIQNEEAQDCADFGTAMKKLTKEQLQEIVGVKANPKQKKVLKFSPWLWSSMSAAAVIAIVVMISFNMINQSQMDFNNAQYMAYNIIAEHNFDDGGFRGGANLAIEDFSAISSEELKEKLHLYETAYQQDQDELIGLNLAMIYLKLHNKDKALEILKELNEEYKDSYPEFAQQCQNIINQIEKIGNKQQLQDDKFNKPSK